MAKATDQQKTEQGTNSGAEHTLPITILRQYIRDLSFENPAAPESLKLKEAPEMEIEIDVQARTIEDGNTPFLYEVVLQLRVITTTSNSPVFLAELEYATLVAVGKDVPEDQHHPVLFIEVPRFAYPFASQIITNTCLQGGFPPLFLKPIDFHSLYIERHKNEIAGIPQEAETAEE